MDPDVELGCSPGTPTAHLPCRFQSRVLWAQPEGAAKGKPDPTQGSVCQLRGSPTLKWKSSGVRGQNDGIPVFSPFSIDAC